MSHLFQKKHTLINNMDFQPVIYVVFPSIQNESILKFIAHKSQSRPA